MDDKGGYRKNLMRCLVFLHRKLGSALTATKVVLQVSNSLLTGRGRLRWSWASRTKIFIIVQWLAEIHSCPDLLSAGDN